MKKYITSTLLIIIIFLVGCSFGSKFDNDEIVAIVRGTEITMGEMRFLYDDDEINDSITLAVKMELAKQEVKDLNLDISEQWEENKYFIKDLTPKDEANSHELADWEFAEKQAKKFDMDPNEFHLQYMEKSMEDISYLMTYLYEMIGEPENDDEATIEEFNREMNILLDNLVDSYDDEIEILL